MGESWNPTNDPSSIDKDWNPESMAWNSESKSVLDSFTWGVVFVCAIKVNRKLQMNVLEFVWN